tara:strand:- start:230 stop:793 length:564 start_codon:yes stop_codon:yes gene_type:complete
MSKCPPGVICIENVSMFMVFLILIPIVYIIYYHTKDKTSPKTDTNIYISSQNTPQENIHDPYQPPLKENTQFMPRQQNGGLPINIPTQHVDTSYKQVGILTRGNNGENILPLMGRSLYSSRDKWQYYTMNDKQNSVKLPISFQGKSCTSEYGCNSLSNGDNVYVEGYQDVFKVTIYENNVMQYIPFI